MIFIEPTDVYLQRAAQSKPTSSQPRPLPPLNDEETEIADIVARLGGGPVMIMKVVNEVARQSGCTSGDRKDAVRLTAMQTIGKMIHVGLLRRVDRKFVLLPPSQSCALPCTPHASVRQ